MFMKMNAFLQRISMYYFLSEFDIIMSTIYIGTLKD